ncbi:hypothetical protein Z949_1408 [Sulfitobacter guttiformis KCTC 32187]|nr:hypothetical protein Z949_1408 [Sulfitobacter guttiformis KCTC 32187]
MGADWTQFAGEGVVCSGIADNQRRLADRNGDDLTRDAGDLMVEAKRATIVKSQNFHRLYRQADNSCDSIWSRYKHSFNLEVLKTSNPAVLEQP